MADISIHAPLAGCDARSIRTRGHRDRFQSTHPLRGATGAYGWEEVTSDISIHAPLAGCDAFALRGGGEAGNISIHAPLAGCDDEQISILRAMVDFNPRTPCGVRQPNGQTSTSSSRFQSTHPLRGATCSLPVKIRRQQFQSTHPLRGATTLGIETAESFRFQSTHPLRGATNAIRNSATNDYKFQSTHPLRGATSVGFNLFYQFRISIHAPLAGCDPP